MTTTDFLHAPAIKGDRKRGPIEAEHRVVPGMTRKLLYQRWASLGIKTVAEVGVADGRNSLAMCEAIPGLRLFCIDPWEPYKGNTRGGPKSQHDGNYQLAQERLKPYNATLIRAKSADAAIQFGAGSLDAVYLDGNHAYEFIAEDLRLWSARVKSGGYVAGHDYYHFARAGVVEAVNEFTSEHGIADWHLTDEREPSFWWLKR